MNERFDVVVTILELIGTAAFAASGALTAIKGALTFSAL